MAYTMAPGRGDTDLLLFQLAKALLARGVKVTGTVQINTERPCNGPCDMDVNVLPDGPVIRISQTLGVEARGCRLNPSALEEAVGLVSQRVSQETGCLIVNKFGKHEAEGRGFRTVMAEALALDVPVLVGLNALNKDAFLEFSGDFAVELPPDVAALESWLLTSMQNDEAAA
ncbi:DUF2478 domain-containing protein [Thalassococcus sp. S3]|uniref:DUF2478 domain-containing protein n=1 Tax=Thalassococcus sp. S3 TaxID=2017482 RepID=UPI00352FD3DD